MSTLNKLPHVKPDLVRTDDNWEEWGMEKFIHGLKKWLKRHKTEERLGDFRKPAANPYKSLGDRDKYKKHWFTKEGRGKDSVNSQRSKGTPLCMYCKKDDWGDSCTTFSTLETRRKFFFDNQLCYNCGKPGHPVDKCRSHSCYKCNGRLQNLQQGQLHCTLYVHSSGRRTGTSSNHPGEDTRSYLVGLLGHRIGAKLHNYPVKQLNNLSYPLIVMKLVE